MSASEREKAIAIVAQERDSVRRRRLSAAELRTTVACLTGLMANIAATGTDGASVISVLDEWVRPDHIRLKAGEMSKREMECVLKSIGDIRQSVLAAFDLMPATLGL